MVFNLTEYPPEYDSDSPPASPSPCLPYILGCSFKKKPATSHQAAAGASLDLTIQGSESSCSSCRPGESLQFPGSDLELFQGCLTKEPVSSRQAAAGASLCPTIQGSESGCSCCRPGESPQFPGSDLELCQVCLEKFRFP